MAQIGELSLPQELVDAALGTKEPEDPPDVAAAKAKAEANMPAWLREPEKRAEVARAMAQIGGLADYVRFHVYDPVILPDSEPITDPESQVHEADIHEDITELAGYISQYSGGTEVADLKPFPGRRVGDSARSGSETVRTEAVEDDGGPGTE